MRIPSFDDFSFDTKSKKQTDYARDLFQQTSDKLESINEITNRKNIKDPVKSRLFPNALREENLRRASKQKTTGGVINVLKSGKKDVRQFKRGLSRGQFRKEKFKMKKESFLQDFNRKAKPPGKRVSKNGNVYYEYRRNRSDRRGSRL